MRRIVIAVVGFELLTLCACGYTLAEDRELTDSISWAREFKAEHPQAARTIAHGCKNELTASAYFTREGALQLFACVRREAEAQGYA